jgi:hypothetical protein
MVAVRGKIFGMKIGAVKFCWLAGAMILFLASPVVRAQSAAQKLPTGHGKDFTTESYFEAPHEQQVRMRLSGAEVTSLPGSLQDIRLMRLDTFREDGTLAMTVRAPQCTFAPFDGVANSPGRLELQTGDGKFRVEGEGFLWRQNDQFLTISNRVRTVIEMPAVKMNAT